MVIHLGIYSCWPWKNILAEFFSSQIQVDTWPVHHWEKQQSHFPCFFYLHLSGNMNFLDQNNIFHCCTFKSGADTDTLSVWHGHFPFNWLFHHFRFLVVSLIFYAVLTGYPSMAVDDHVSLGLSSMLQFSASKVPSIVCPLGSQWDL